MNFFELIFWLIFAHIIGDMALQTEFIAHNKGKYFYLMFCHIMIYLGVIGITFYLLGMFSWMAMFWIAGGHLSMDLWKSKQPKDEAHFWQIYVDQGWHYFQLLIVAGVTLL